MAQYTQINPDALVTALTPINNSLGGKQDKTDSTLATTDKTISGAINEINTKVGNLTGALTWKGKFDTLPAVTDYKAGNVVGVGNKEYVLTVTGSTKAWEELGDEGSYLLKSVAEETYAKKTSIPTVNDPKVSIKMNGAEKGSFTLNQASAGEVDLGTVITAHQDISGKVDKTTLLNTLMVVDLTSDDITVRKAALDDFKAKWLALGNTDLTGARFIGRFRDANGNTSIHESGKGLIGEDTLLIYKQISPAFPTGFYGLSYIKDMANSLCGLYQIYVDYDTASDPGNIEITQIRDSETFDWLNRFVYAEAPSTYLKITDAESTYETKTHAAETLTETLRDYAKSEEVLAMADMATANAKYDLSLVLKEIDLTGTDADRKAKLDQFAKDWKILTNATDMVGARFVGRYVIDDSIASILFTYSYSLDNYVGISTNETVRIYEFILDRQGSITVTPLFSHLEGITIKTSNTTEAMNANKAAIQAYANNLIELGVDTTKGFNVPVIIDGNHGFYGCLTSRYITGAEGYFLSGSVFSVGGANYIKDIYISPSGLYGELVNIMNDNELLTTSKDLIGAINEVNTLAKSKGNGTITGVKMNGVSKGASGVVDLGTVITAHQDISGKVDKTTLLNTLMVVDLSSTDIAVRKAALDDFKAKWLALGNTDLNGARFIAKSYFNLPGPPENNVIMTYVENGLVATGYTGIAIASYNSIIGSYRVNIALDGTMSYNAIQDPETTDAFQRFAWGEVPSTYLKITDAESTYAKKTSIPTVNDPKVSIKMNGAEKGSFTLNQASAGEVDLGTVITAHQDISGKQDKLISGTNIKTINGESVLGSGDITISSGASSSAYPEVNHGTGDTTFTLTPNTFHVWDEVASLTLNFGNETSGVANEYLFQFTSGSTATSLTLPDSIKWANDNAPTIGANMIYQVSVLRGLASVLEFNNAKVFPIIGDTGSNANEEYAKVYEYFVSTYNLISGSDNPSNGVIITETLICNDTNLGGPVLKVSLSGTRLLLWTQKAINNIIVPTINNLGVYYNYMWD